MTYEQHNPKKCDKCERRKAKHKVPFLYLDTNDKAHEDVSHLVGQPNGTCYRQYEVCDECFKAIKKSNLKRLLERRKIKEKQNI